MRDLIIEEYEDILTAYETELINVLNAKTVRQNKIYISELNVRIELITKFINDLYRL
jgi:hypothetical protein